MGKNLSILLAGVLLGVLIAAGGFALVWRHGAARGTSQARVLKLAHGLDPSHPVHRGMVFMQERVEALSQGRLTIEIYASGVLGGETECLEQLQNGVLPMTKSSSGPMEAFVPEMEVFGLPYLFADAAHFWRFAESEAGRRLLHAGAKRNLYGLCFYDAGSRSFYTRSRPIRTPDDLRGLKIRVMNSPMAIRLVQMMGGSPTPISWGELYSALAQGTVDGAENNPPSFYSSKHYEVCRHYTLNEHLVLPDILLISTPIWNQLDPQEQAWLQQAADESSVFQRALWARQSAEALEAVNRLGVEVVIPDRKPFMERVAPLYAPYEGTAIGGLVRFIRELK